MNLTPIFPLAAILALAVPIIHAEEPEPPAEKSEEMQKAEWIQLFNGKDLEDWTPKFTGHEAGVNFRDTFRVEDGILKVDYSKWDEFKGEFGHLFYKTPFSNYRLRIEYRFVGDQIKGGPGWARRNNGAMIHGQTVESMKLDQEFPDSIEVQLLGAEGDEKRGTLSICTPGTQLVRKGKLTKAHVIKANGPSYPGDQWVTVEVEVHGDKLIKHIAEGKTVIEYTKPQLDDATPLTGGTISIQAETHPTEFRKIELLPLDE